MSPMAGKREGPGSGTQGNFQLHSKFGTCLGCVRPCLKIQHKLKASRDKQVEKEVEERGWKGVREDRRERE